MSKELLCNVNRPSLNKLALLTEHKLTRVIDRPTALGIKTFCKLDGVDMTTGQALKEIHAYIRENDIVLVNHNGWPLAYNKEI